MKKKTDELRVIKPEQKKIKPKATTASELRAKTSSLKVNRLQYENDINFASHVNHVLEQLESLNDILKACISICDHAIVNSTKLVSNDDNAIVKSKKLVSNAENIKNKMNESIDYIVSFMKRLDNIRKEVKERIKVNPTNIGYDESNFVEFKTLMKYKYNFKENEINMTIVFDNLMLHALKADLADIRFNICTLIIMQKDTFTYFEKDFFNQFLFAYSELLFDRNLMAFDSFKVIPVAKERICWFHDGREIFVNDIPPDTQLTNAVEDESGRNYIFNFLPKQQGKASLGFIIQICYPNEEERMIFVKQFYNNSWMLRKSNLKDDEITLFDCKRKANVQTTLSKLQSETSETDVVMQKSSNLETKNDQTNQTSNVENNQTSQSPSSKNDQTIQESNMEKMYPSIKFASSKENSSIDNTKDFDAILTNSADMNRNSSSSQSRKSSSSKSRKSSGSQSSANFPSKKSDDLNKKPKNTKADKQMQNAHNRNNFCIDVEFFGYFFLNKLGMAPDFIVSNSLAFNEPLIVMEQIPENYKFLNDETIYKNCLEDQNYIKFCASIQFLRIFHHLFLIDDFHTGNVAVFQGDFQIVDLWTSRLKLDKIFALRDGIDHYYQFIALEKLLTGQLSDLLQGKFVHKKLCDIPYKKLILVWLTSKSLEIFQSSNFNDINVQIENRKRNKDSWAKNNSKLLYSFIMKAKNEAEQEIKRFNVQGNEKKWNKYWAEFTTDNLYSEIYEVLVNAYKPVKPENKDEDEDHVIKYQDELKLLIDDVFNKNIKSFLISKNENDQQKNKVNELTGLIEILCKKPNQDGHNPNSHVLLIYCKSSQRKTIQSAKLNTIFQADFVDDTNSRIVIFVDTFFIYDFIFHSLKEKLHGENFVSQVETHKILSEFKIKLEIPEK